MEMTNKEFSSHFSDTFTPEIKAFGCRINTFGQVHQADKTITWWGPDSWRTRGVMWSDEYALWPQGILKSPELYRL